jgi:hypothetical protein
MCNLLYTIQFSIFCISEYFLWGLWTIDSSKHDTVGDTHTPILTGRLLTSLRYWYSANTSTVCLDPAQLSSVRCTCAFQHSMLILVRIQYLCLYRYYKNTIRAPVNLFVYPSMNFADRSIHRPCRPF